MNMGITDNIITGFKGALWEGIKQGTVIGASAGATIGVAYVIGVGGLSLIKGIVNTIAARRGIKFLLTAKRESKGEWERWKHTKDIIDRCSTYLTNVSIACALKFSKSPKDLLLSKIGEEGIRKLAIVVDEYGDNFDVDLISNRLRRDLYYELLMYCGDTNLPSIFINGTDKTTRGVWHLVDGFMSEAAYVLWGKRLNIEDIEYII